MMGDYFKWQYVTGPKWFLNMAWNAERASVKFFSIPIMLKTLFAYWHKDAMPFEGGTITEFVMAVMWNIVSRLIGALIRTIMILIWLALQVIMIPLVVAVLMLFVLWPLLVIVGLAAGLVMLVL